MQENVLISKLLVLVTCIGLLHWGSTDAGILYPQESESREVKNLDGIWAFRIDGNEGKIDQGFQERWYEQQLFMSGKVDLMPVPSSFNDITQKVEVRDHIGWVWYQTTFWVPQRWQQDNRSIFLRFGSANYFAVVWVNGQHVMNHTGGHLPFKGEVSSVVQFGTENLLVVALNNTLTPLTVPQGSLSYPNDSSRYPKGYTVQTYNFDYFHFAGIHRPVYLYTTPKFYIDDITVVTDILDNNQLLGFESKTGIVAYSVDVVTGFHENSIDGANQSIECLVVVRDKHKRKINLSRTCSGVIDIPGVLLWWPYTGEPEGESPGYLYTLEVTLINSAYPEVQDVYRLKFGVRTVESTDDGFRINGKPFYFRGFGRHEDYSIRGRGVDWAMLVKDHNLIQWTGANSYRTSHYPYAEEILDLTDSLGIVIIDESPAIGLSGFGAELEKNHIQVMQELVSRDKNRASVVMWSIGNEPKSMQLPSKLYFEKVIAETRFADPAKRPITIVLSEGFPEHAGPSNLDVVSINRYFGWYGDTGRTDVIHLQMPTEVHSWYNNYKKPVLVTEYGAGSIAGMHYSPAFVWTEDYQVEYLIEHFKAFDKLRKDCPFFIGEMIWNFADFATPPETFRPWGCMKGIFTRERQPKNAAHVVRQRYWTLANLTSSHPLPRDLINLLPSLPYQNQNFVFS